MKKQRNKTNPHKRASVSTIIRKAKPDQNKPQKNWHQKINSSASHDLKPRDTSSKQTIRRHNKWHQTIHQHTIEFSKNTHPPDVFGMKPAPMSSPQSALNARDLVLGSGPAQAARASCSGTSASPGLAAPGELLSAVRRLSYTGANNASNRLVSGLVWRRRNSSCRDGPPTTVRGAGRRPPAATPGP